MQRRSNSLAAAAAAAMSTPTPTINNNTDQPFSLASLAPELHSIIASYMHGNDVVHGVSSTAKACRSSFFPGVTSDLCIGGEMSTMPPPPTPEEEAASAAVLARLLKRMPGLTSLSVEGRVARALGHAIRRLERPLTLVTEVHVWGQPGPDELPLAKAMAEGRLPALHSLTSGLASLFRRRSNAQLLEEAIQRGHLSQLAVVWMFEPDAFFDAVIAGFCAMPPEVQRRQKQLQTLVMFSELTWVDEEALTAALRLPPLSGLKHLVVNPDLLEFMVGYLTHEGGRPSLTSLGLDFTKGYVELDLAPLVGALGAGGGAPNLEELDFEEGGGNDMIDALSAIYAAGGLSKLRKLSFTLPFITEETLRSFFDSVGATPHKGEALQVIEIKADSCDDDIYNDLLEAVGVIKEEFETAQARGVFPTARLITEIELDEVGKRVREGMKEMRKTMKEVEALLDAVLEEEGPGGDA